MPPDDAKPWNEVQVPDDVRDAYTGLLRSLYELQPATDEGGRCEPFQLRLTSDAKEVWQAFYNNWSGRMNLAVTAERSLLSKLRGTVLRLALIHHVVSCVAARGDAKDNVPRESIQAGIDLVEWFYHEARRFQARRGEAPDQADRRRLVDLISQRFKGRITASNLHKRNKSRYPNTEQAKDALDDLERLKLGAWCERRGSRGGRPTMEFVLTPPYPETP